MSSLRSSQRQMAAIVPPCAVSSTAVAVVGDTSHEPRYESSQMNCSSSRCVPWLDHRHDTSYRDDVHSHRYPDEESEQDDRHLAKIYLAHLAQPVSISIRMTAVNGLAQTQCVTE